MKKCETTIVVSILSLFCENKIALNTVVASENKDTLSDKIQYFNHTNQQTNKSDNQQLVMEAPTESNIKLLHLDMAQVHLSPVNTKKRKQHTTA